MPSGGSGDPFVLHRPTDRLLMVDPARVRDKLAALRGYREEGMRNRLVHLYDEVDDALVARVVDENLGDRDAFARAFARHVTDDS